MIIYTQTELWLLVALVLVIFEMSAPGLFYFFSFAFGTIIAAAASYLKFSLAVQFSGLLVGSAVILLALRVWVKKINKPNAKQETNLFALAGKKGIVVKSGSENQFAQVRVGGEVWSAQTANSKTLETGAFVKIIKVAGAKLIVETDGKVKE